MKRAVAVITLLALSISCKTSMLPPISSTGPEFEPFRDELKLWEQAREEEAKLRENATIYPDPLLEDYLGEVVGRLTVPGMAANRQLGYRVAVIEDPTLNAFAYPHGSLFVHTGLLARMENEDQLATVLGHEMAHVEGRHMLRYQRSARNKQIGWGIAAITAAVILAGEEGEALEKGQYGKAARIGVLGDLFIGLGLTLAVLASINGYGRNLEREADAGAFNRLVAAGYDVEESPQVYRLLMEEHGDSGKAEAFFFGSHPQLADRVEAAEQFLAQRPDTGAAPSRGGDPDKFARRIRPVIRDDARLNVQMGRLELAEDQLSRVLEMMPGDPESHYILGLLRLAQADKGPDTERAGEWRQQAAGAFRESIRLDPARPAPHRELGLLAYRAEDFFTACTEFRRYVELETEADDVPRIRDYILELERDGECR
ncbi:MAG: M48 family metalloprotease [Acidobacteria bacterium]|nr:M48 family metalloprotease [Acidobacteriota bacterium]NIM60954.1 M48 family metalloprotease [Acidobacteriota bacterium]NIO60444.1 M48 family metalloprotease [Acidobacteriota bacterium]NIQ31542.1 M48 family metalloprotease [Acidobacteriota bacterium]NIQ86794.1 M48 family metalloprotease [Acidobacteriota bacterium]